jgi:hypothetical protein
MVVYSHDVALALPAVQADYTDRNGSPFRHFYCPILHRDEETDLCMGHVVNEKIANSCRATVVQRSDVDSWYGSMFESDFLALLEARESSLHDVFSTRHLRQRLRPQFRLDGKEIRHYACKEPGTPEHTPIMLENEQGAVFRFALDMRPDEMRASLQGNWEVAVEADFRLPALVSLIKAAYLTLFRVLGYHYALSPAGLLVGNYMLGKFYRENQGTPKSQVWAAAVPFFQPYVNMVRPIAMYSGTAPLGTVEDRTVKACFGGSGRSFAMMVCVRTNQDLHAVLMPAFNHPDAVETYLNFLKEEDKQALRVWTCQYDEQEKCWRGSAEPTEARWPKGSETITLE